MAWLTATSKRATEVIEKCSIATKFGQSTGGLPAASFASVDDFCSLHFVWWPIG